MNQGCAGLKDGKCTWLRGGKCGNGTCSFYQTKEQAETSRKKWNNRLAGLVQSQQAYIADKYHGGKMPWLQENN